MILTFNPQFIEPIKAGTKIHTIRTDIKGSWKPGMKIHFWVGNPRNVKENPYLFQSGICTKVENINIDFIIDEVIFKDYDIWESYKLDMFAQNDGFEDWEELKKWFADREHRYFFSGKLIHFKVHATI